MMAELLNHIDSYLLGQITARGLEDWLLGNLQAVLDSRDKGAIELANKVDADMVELAEGLVSESEIRERFHSYVMASQTVPIHDEQTEYASETEFVTASTTSTTSATVKQDFRITLVEDYRFEAQFA